MANLQLRVTYTDGRRVEARVKPRTEVEFERTYGTSLAAAADAMRNEFLYFLAWDALTRGGHESAPFDDFLDRIDDVGTVKETAEEGKPAEDPSPAARPSGGSSS